MRINSQLNTNDYHRSKSFHVFAISIVNRIYIQEDPVHLHQREVQVRDTGNHNKLGNGQLRSFEAQRQVPTINFAR